MSNWKVPLAIAGSGSVALGLVWSQMSKSKSVDKEKTPEKWILVGQISELIIYPVKSCQGIVVQEAEVTELGLKGTEFLRDRIFAIVDAKGNCQTQRIIPKMATLKPEVKEDVLILSFQDIPSFSLKVPDESLPCVRKRLRIFDEELKGIDCGDEVANWLSQNLEKEGLRLYFHGLKEGRQTAKFITRQEGRFSAFTLGDKGTFQDETSFMLMTEESVAELNANLKRTVTHRNFRPCILIKGTPEPFCEDFWSYVRIGKNLENQIVLKGSMPCQRCKLTTVTPEGEFDPDGEPVKTLKALKKKRQVGDEVTNEIVKNDAIMGLHLGLFNKEEEGRKIRVGDPIYAALL